MKCLQCFVAIKQLLHEFGVESRLWVGAVCEAEVFEEAGWIGWGGFWDQDHHIWLVTEFAEFVDLSISQLHLHPRRRRSDGIPIPPIWWSDIGTWPCVLRYLLDSPAGFAFNETDQADLELFLAKGTTSFDDCALEIEVGSPAFGPILHGSASMNELFEAGNAWVTRSIVLQHMSLPLPLWVQEREQEFLDAHKRGQRASSRLAPNT